jgi:hypothetical protein
MSAAVDPVDAVAYSANVTFVGALPNTTFAGTLAMVETAGVSTLLVGSSSFPPGSYTAVLGLQQSTTQSVSWSASFSCCNQTLSMSEPDTRSASFLALVVPFQVMGDDGGCELDDILLG